MRALAVTLCAGTPGRGHGETTMPLIGHAVAGWIVAREVPPGPPRPTQWRAKSESDVLWLPFLVGLAYLPDIVTQAGTLAGWSAAPRASHSLLFGFVSAPLAATVLAVVFHYPPRRGFILAAGSILLHDALDVLQGSDRRPLWPFSQSSVDLPWPLIPQQSWLEASLFGAGLALYLLLRGWRPTEPESGAPITLGLAAVIAALALGTHALRGVREAQLEAARSSIELHDYARGLPLLEQALRWPSTAKPGRADYLRGEAYFGLGDRPQAERAYLEAYAADPHYFWVVADLAAFYASGSEPETARRDRAEPFLRRLRTDFADHPALPQTLARVEGLLAP
jgi:hypothetical protein